MIKPASNLSLQDRDLALLRGLFESRVMTARHIAILYFDGKEEATKKRLHKLKAAGFIGERRRRAFEPAILFLTRKAFSTLHQRGILAEYPTLDKSSLDKRSQVKELTLRHELEVMDVKAAFCAMLAKSKKFTVAEFTTWPLLCQFETSRPGHSGDILVRPDGFIRIHEKEPDGGVSEHTFFLEVDRSSEQQDVLISRAGAYLDYYRSGGFAVRNGAARLAFRDFPFRVLMVLKSAERRNNTAERLAQTIPPILTQVWLATMADVSADPTGAIWIQPVDYRNVVKGTRFYNEHPKRSFEFRRQPEREDLVEAKIPKKHLL